MFCTVPELLFNLVFEGNREKMFKEFKYVMRICLHKMVKPICTYLIWTGLTAFLSWLFELFHNVFSKFCAHTPVCVFVFLSVRVCVCVSQISYCIIH